MSRFTALCCIAFVLAGCKEQSPYEEWRAAHCTWNSTYTECSLLSQPEPGQYASATFYGSSQVEIERAITMHNERESGWQPIDSITKNAAKNGYVYFSDRRIDQILLLDAITGQSERWPCMTALGDSSCGRNKRSVDFFPTHYIAETLPPRPEPTQEQRVARLEYLQSLTSITVNSTLVVR